MSDSNSGDSKKVLIVDDDPDLREVLVSRLRRIDLETLTAENGNAALQMIKSHKPDLIILDVMMPGMTGYDLVVQMKTMSDSVKKIPIIVITGRKSMAEYFQGVHSVMIKPFDIPAFLKNVQDALGINGSAPVVAAKPVEAAKSAPAPGAPKAPAAAPPPEPKKSASTPEPSKPPPAVASPAATSPAAATSWGGPKKVLFAAHQEFILTSVKNFLETKKHIPILATDVPDALQLLKSDERLDVIIAQFHEDPNKMDVEKIFAEASKNPKTKTIPFVVFCDRGLSMDAVKVFKASQVITYDKIGELTKKIDDYLMTGKVKVG